MMPATGRSSSISTYSSSVTPPGVWVHSTGVKPCWASDDSMIWANEREDRVLQLGHDQADQAGAALAQPRGAFVAEHVERGEDGLPGVRGDAGAVVEHPGHRGLADLRLPGDVSEPGTHGGTA